MAALAVGGLLAASCGGDDLGTPVTTEGSGRTAPPTEDSTKDTTDVAPAGAVRSLDQVESAVVQIVGEGTFVDPAEGQRANVAGAGSGFIIDPSGLAVTNNHVVTGAALLEVYIPGEDEPRNARVVAVSECSDLAVIDIEGDGFPYLQWYEGPVTTGLEIYAAGYPLGDPEYTLLDGIVSKADVDGETYWSSVDEVIEHSADTLPGNSGGPIVTSDGLVVAVNYAGNDMGQSFAIARDTAEPIIETLRGGVDLETIGVNGEAITDGSFSGVWVYSVKSGSPADVTGVQAGDLITSMEDLILALDGTMASYCDILRSHNADDVLTIEVYRPGSDQVLRGQLNGRELEEVTSFQADVDVPDAPATPDAPTYDEYVTITDDSNLIEVSVPAAWSQIDGSYGFWYNEEQVGPGLVVTTDLAMYFEGFDTPGVFIGASALLGMSPDEYLDGEYYGDACTYDGRYDYDDGLYAGRYDLYFDCGGTGSTYILVAAQPYDGTFLVVVDLVAVSEADLAAADQVLATFQVIGALGG